MMAATCFLFSVQYVRKNTKVVVVRFAAKKARYRLKNSDAVGQDVKMAIRSFNKSRGRLNTTLGIPDPTE